ncbi:MAG: diguanylate cyclase [Pseudomonadota bacterium]
MKILLADDDRVALLYLQDALQDWGYEVVLAHDGATALAILQGPDAPVLAVIDWMMPGMDGTDICRRLRAGNAEHYTYVLMLTARTETSCIVEAMNAGADDFVSKPFNIEEIQVRIKAGRRILELEHELRRRATHDVLTGLYNRGAIIGILENELARHARDKRPVAVVFCDLDHFKRINDGFGHQAGDEVLRVVARRIDAMLRPYDSVGRYGGEELLVVLPACTAGGAIEVAERIRASVAEEAVGTPYGEVSVTLSLGVAVAEGGTAALLDELLRRADNALYEAKRKGRNRVELAP